MAKEPAKEKPSGGITRFNILPLPVRIWCLTLFATAIGAFLLFTFTWSINGWTLYGVMYYYIIFACFHSCVFLVLPARKRDRMKILWYDFVISAVVFGIYIYYILNAWAIDQIGWVPPPTTLAFVLACITGVFALEGGRRMAGPAFVIIALIIGGAVLFADKLPGVLYGMSSPFDVLIGSFIFGKGGIIGIPGMVIGTLAIGFLMFAGMLLASGAGTFFLNLALSLLGRYRGGPAKVAVLASGLFGSISGSPVANVVSTGAVTIPAMKKSGYPPYYSGAVEAVASTGGIIMPPVMGGVAFVMSILTDIPYAVIIAAAFLPALLYYWGLVIQVDAYAARVGLKGLPREDIPPLLRTLKEGWTFIFAIAFLVFGLIYMRWGVMAPVYAAASMIPLSFTSRTNRMTPRKLMAALASIGGLICFVTAILVPVGLVMVGINSTGAFTALTTFIISLGGDLVLVSLLIAIVVCYIFGMIGQGMTPYIVLAVTLIPSLAAGTNLDLMAIHLFVMYFVIMSYITPPVAIAAFIAAAMAGSSMFKTGFTAMRLAVVLYFIPFFFLFNTALILDGPISETIYLFVQCLVGIWVLCSGLEGYMIKVGKLSWWWRPVLVVSGFMIAFPQPWWITAIGLAVTAVVVALIFASKKVMNVKRIGET